MGDQVSHPYKTAGKIKFYGAKAKNLANLKFKDNREVKTL